MQSVKDKVRAFLLENFLMGAGDQEIRDETSFMESHILDSTGFIELISYLEEQFQIQVNDDEMVPDNLDSLSNVEQFVSGSTHHAHIR